MSKEVWKDIKGYEGYYQVSSLGNVKSLEREEIFKNKKGKTIKRLRKERILTQKVNEYGYAEVNLWKDGKNKYLRVHRLVGISFIPNPENKPVVNHKDGNKLNNCVTNLEWNTVSENTWHATHVLGTNDYKKGLVKATEACKKKTIILDTKTNKIHNFDSRKEAAEFFGAIDFQSLAGHKKCKKFSHLKLINEED